MFKKLFGGGSSKDSSSASTLAGRYRNAAFEKDPGTIWESVQSLYAASSSQFGMPQSDEEYAAIIAALVRYGIIWRNPDREILIRSGMNGLPDWSSARLFISAVDFSRNTHSYRFTSTISCVEGSVSLPLFIGEVLMLYVITDPESSNASVYEYLAFDDSGNGWTYDKWRMYPGEPFIPPAFTLTNYAPNDLLESPNHVDLDVAQWKSTTDRLWQAYDGFGTARRGPRPY